MAAHIDWHARAHESWNDLTRVTGMRSPRGIRVHEPSWWRVVAAWPLSQVLHAAVLVDAAGIAGGGSAPTSVWRSFRRYRRGDGFSTCRSSVKLRRQRVDRSRVCAAGAVHVGRRGCALAAPGRGVAAVRQSRCAETEECCGRRGGDRLHACSTGSAGLLAAGVARADGRSRSLARAAGVFIDTELVNPDGLIADSIGPDGDVDPSEFTYNQGLAIQLRIERVLTAHARELADIFIREFAGDRFWTHAACFNAILCRALLRLDAVTESRTYESFVTDYADRLWRDARDDRGLFSGAGRYDAGYVLDHPPSPASWPRWFSTQRNAALCCSRPPSSIGAVLRCPDRDWGSDSPPR